ncbi:TIGR02300 family protein [Roseicyclus sp. F158]|uniref:TIGR02300 family protein n=1 Tax=Tropicimonas omnivorans TaxID=3075590 RepID=A0ABU3DDI1_9RHOB|nr:TIGR02300 family protein [Roseicyclus sp. F158]MDT0681768.1 TIGR02300 family protein [Roseicyclus sp. F158]
MPKEEWGTKRLCPTTGKRFYDLGRTPVISPYTGEAVNLETGKAKAIAKEPKATAKKADDLIEDETPIDNDDNDTDVDLGDDVLEDDDEDSVSLDDIADRSNDDDDN